MRGMGRRAGLLMLVPVMALLGSCSSAAPASPDTVASPDTSVSTGPDTVRVDVDKRPFALHVPTSYHQGTAVPLVVILHGYTSDGARQESYFKLTAQSDARGFLYAMPDGQRNQQGQRYWNGTDACCDFGNSGVDDSTYLSHLISTVERSYSVDRVFLIGHSNGAFMAIRMACEHAGQLTGIVGLNGAMWNDKSRCRPSRPVSFLDIRSVADETILFAGGLNAGIPYPSAATTDHLILNRDDERVAALAGRTAAQVSYYGVAADLRSVFPNDEELYGGEIRVSTLPADVELRALPHDADPAATLAIGGDVRSVRLRAEGRLP